jgi:hypothetical protein
VYGLEVNYLILCYQNDIDTVTCAQSNYGIVVTSVSCEAVGKSRIKREMREEVVQWRAFQHFIPFTTTMI